MKCRLISHYILNTITREMNPISLENLAVISFSLADAASTWPINQRFMPKWRLQFFKTLKIIQSTVIWRAKIFVCSIFSL